MIDQVSYDEMVSYSKELEASADAIKELIENKDLRELENFIDSIYNYSEYLSSTVELHKQADEALEYLTDQKRTSN